MNAAGAYRGRSLYSGVAASVVIALACVYLFLKASGVVSGIVWTDNFDSLRDIGMAHAILDGRYPEDPVYSGETLWYNPLIAACVACGSRLTGLDPVEMDVRLGPVMNLLVPVAFFVLMLYWFDPWVAVAATAYLLFGRPPTKPVWMTATYSPVLLAGNFSLAPFFLTLLAYTRFVRGGGVHWRMATGVLWGLTFIGHAAPAVMLGIVLSVGELFRWRRLVRHGGRWVAINGVREYAAILALAFACSLPYTYSIIWNYHFHILNEWPTRYVDPYIDFRRLPAFLGECATPSTVIAAIGLIAMLLTLRRRTERRLAVLWWLTGIAFLAYSFAAQALDENWHVAIPRVVPGHHAMLFISAAKALLFGFGILTLVRLPFGQVFNRLKSADARRYCRRTLDCVAALAVLGVLAVTYRSPTELDIMGNCREFNKAHEDTRAAYDWIVANTKPDDAFLCEWDVAARLVNATGRKLVATMLWYSNPYVDFQRRQADKNALFDAMRNRDEKAFCTLATTWNVRYVLLQKQRNLSDPNGHEIASEVLDGMGLPFVERVFAAGRYTVYRVKG